MIIFIPTVWGGPQCYPLTGAVFRYGSLQIVLFSPVQIHRTNKVLPDVCRLFAHSVLFSPWQPLLQCVNTLFYMVTFYPRTSSLVPQIAVEHVTSPLLPFCASATA